MQNRQNLTNPVFSNTLYMYILPHLSPEDIGRLAGVNHQFYSITTDPTLWSNLCKKHFNFSGRADDYKAKFAELNKAAEEAKQLADLNDMQQIGNAMGRREQQVPTYRYEPGLFRQQRPQGNREERLFDYLDKNFNI